MSVCAPPPPPPPLPPSGRSFARVCLGYGLSAVFAAAVRWGRACSRAPSEGGRCWESKGGEGENGKGGRWWWWGGEEWMIIELAEWGGNRLVSAQGLARGSKIDHHFDLILT